MKQINESMNYKHVRYDLVTILYHGAKFEQICESTPGIPTFTCLCFQGISFGDYLVRLKEASTWEMLKPVQ